MYEQIFRICGVALLCAVGGAVVGNAVGGARVAVRLAGITLIFGALMGMLDGASAVLEETVMLGKAYGYGELMLKGLGIATLCRICADVCRDCGEPTAAAGVESAGKIGMLLLALPAVLIKIKKGVCLWIKIICFVSV